MAEESRRVVWRRRIAPFALLVALVLLATRTCRSQGAEVELRFDLGRAVAGVRDLEVAVHRDPAEAPVGQWTGRPSAGPMRPWRLRMAPGSYTLVFRATRTDGGLVRFERGIEVTDDGGAITVPVEQALASPSD